MAGTVETRLALADAECQPGVPGGPLPTKRKRLPKNTGIEVAEAGDTFLEIQLEHLDPAMPEGSFSLRTFQMF